MKVSLITKNIKIEENDKYRFIFPISNEAITAEYLEKNKIDTVRIYEYNNILNNGLNSTHDSYIIPMIGYIKVNNMNTDKIYPYANIMIKEPDKEVLARYDKVVLVLVQNK